MRFKALSNLVRPKEHIELLRPLLSDRYAPLQPNGNGIQSVYLTGVSEGFAEALIALIGPEAIAVQANAIQADRSMTVATRTWNCGNTTLSPKWIETSVFHLPTEKRSSPLGEAKVSSSSG